MLLHPLWTLDSIVPCVSQCHNDALLKPFEVEEVRSALFSMFLDKAPGHDGMNPGFYQHFWDVETVWGGGLGYPQVGYSQGLRPLDRMEWSFLRKMLLALGFVVEWVNLIMLCVTTVSYSFLVNGENAGQVIPTHGIRQGDPLSPYLFIICAEGLSLLLQQVESRGLFHGCRVARGAPPISHLFFAYDSLLFFKAIVQEACVIKQCLNEYEDMSGQAENFHKSRRNKRTVFSYIEYKIKHRIGTWNKRLLSQAGTDRGIHWKACDRLCVPKKFGGLGFKDLRAFNLAMLGKQAWRFLTRPHTLVARIYKARYFPRSSFINATLGSCPSFCWRSVVAAHELVCSGVRRRVGNGASTLIWEHPWLPDDLTPMI
ncbi:uncharacterized protein LOC116001061 [Ipomoea triloba]|uniref:uncharacterized protein LOC116001061 n=1 Tax=Ipomoea triloba TaxID=35885 RepID=UPI00125E5E1C|nr:uncharacterized protein LOC116001061 [Ipomoea triloba]